MYCDDDQGLYSASGKSLFFRFGVPMINNNSAELREWAARCEGLAASTSDETERASLLRKCEALRALADSEDWLAGAPSAPSATAREDSLLARGDRAQAAE